MKEGVFNLKSKNEKIKIGDNLERIILLLDSVKKENKDLIGESKEEFEECYNELKNKIDKVLLSAGEYERAKMNMERVIKLTSLIDQDINEHKERVSEMDTRRRIIHNALISYVTELSRYITNYFKENVADSIKKKIKFKRAILPKQGFLPDNFDIKNRYDIEKWSDIIYQEVKEYAITLSKGSAINDEDKIIYYATEMVDSK